MKLAWFSLTATAIGLASSVAKASPQWDTNLVPAGCLLGDDGALFERVAFCGSAQVDLLLLRESTRDFGLGGYAGVGTAAFSDFRIGAGARALIPILEDFPLVASLGGVLRDGRDFGVESSLFWGARGFNFHGSYNLAGGVVITQTHLFEGPRSNSLAVGLQVDGFVLAAPFLLLLGALQ
ncbi:MAG: hypothetical protein QM756_23325 [Polyangiaceae bacterium]